MNYRIWSVVTIVILVVVACSKQITNEFRGFVSPPHFPIPNYDMDKNPITEEGFYLGKTLFYETLLSRNNTISCGSCHIQSAAFTHHGHDVSHGIDDRLGKRNSQPIMNLAYQTNFMWDGGIFDLDLQPIAPITAHEEMDESLSNVIDKLNRHDQYPQLFKQAFGTEEITTVNLMKALSQFMLMAISSNSKYDSVQMGYTKFTEDEAKGYEIVQQKCGSCHAEPLFTNHQFINNGIGKGASDDKGRYEITLQEKDKYKFRVPSLRNLSFTAPYMHDGRYYTLDAVLNHYSKIRSVEGTDSLLYSNGVWAISLNEDEKRLIKVFLNTLNDRVFITNPLLAE